MTTQKTIVNLAGEHERVSLPTAHWHHPEMITASVYKILPSLYREHFCGIWITALYAGPRSNRKFVRVYSTYESKTKPGTIVGDTYRELNNTEYLRYCDRLNILPLHCECLEKAATLTR
jgi:hypothetical protein